MARLGAGGYRGDGEEFLLSLITNYLFPNCQSPVGETEKGRVLNKGYH